MPRTVADATDTDSPHGSAHVIVDRGLVLIFQDQHVHPEDAAWVDTKLKDLGITHLPAPQNDGQVRVWEIISK